MSDLGVTPSDKIPGLLQVKLVVHSDNRGSFTEIYQAEKLGEALGDFRPLQTNLSKNTARGILRGIHAEPWNKYISPLSGQVFVAIVDLRGDNFGTVEAFELEFGEALFVPQGCGNSYLTLSEDVDYLYHVDAHWQRGLSYPSINPFDPDLNIAWPSCPLPPVISTFIVFELP